MFNAAQRTIVLAVVASLGATALAGGDVNPPYPFIVVKPALPFAEKDSVVLRILRGLAVNEYKAPTYDYPAVPFSIEISPLTIFPPAYSVTVHYKEIPPPPNTITPDIYNPVDYGPTFKLGVLKMGRYTVIDSGKSVGTFDVVKEGAIPVSTVTGIILDDPYPLKIASRPIPGVTVLVKKRIPAPSVDPSGGLFVETPVCTTVSGTKGEFAVKKLTSGFYRLYCTHAEFNNAAPGIDLLKDTTIAVAMVAKTAAAIVAGNVVEISPASIAPKPVEGCTVQVERPAIYFTAGGGAPGLEPGLPPYSARAVTDASGAYVIPKIPIAYNGEKWLIRAFKNGYGSEGTYAALYNLKTDSVDFRLEPPFMNAHSDTIGGIVFTMASNKSHYAAGEGVTARYSIFNPTPIPAKFFPFEKNCVYDMTVTDPAGKVLFRLSDITGGVNPPMGVEITVQSGQTVTEAFPTYFVPKFTSAQFNGEKEITLTIAGRLRGKKYDSTEVAVPIKILLHTTQAQPAPREAVPVLTCRPIHDRIVLTASARLAVSFTVYALDGKIRRDLSFKKELAAGTHGFAFDSRKTPGGVFIIKVATGGYSKAFKVCSGKE